MLHDAASPPPLHLRAASLPPGLLPPPERLRQSRRRILIGTVPRCTMQSGGGRGMRPSEGQAQMQDREEKWLVHYICRAWSSLAVSPSLEPSGFDRSFPGRRGSPLLCKYALWRRVVGTFLFRLRAPGSLLSVGDTQERAE